MEDKKQVKKLNVPNLRFPEFTDEWKCFLLSDLLDFFPTNSLSWDQLEYGKGDLRNLHYGLIHVGLQTLVDLSKNQLPIVKSNNFPRNFEIIKEGDVAFADASEDTNDVAKAIEFIYTDDIPSICGLHTIHGRDKLNLTVPGFKGYYFSSNAFHDQVKRIAQGTKIFSVSPKLLSECKICLPSSLEQKKISSLLSLIDERIDTQNKIIDKLQSLMSGIAESLTAKTPNTKIADCLVCHSSSLQENQVGPLEKYKVFGANSVCGFTDQPDIITDSILIVKDGSGVGTVSYAEGKYSVIGTSNYLTAKDGYLLRYLYYCLMCFNFTPYKTGMAIPHIYFKDYGKAKIYCPAIEEQRKIAAALSKIERKIEIEQSIMQQYSMQKQYLLQQMFI